MEISLVCARRRKQKHVQARPRGRACAHAVEASMPVGGAISLVLLDLFLPHVLAELILQPAHGTRANERKERSKYNKYSLILFFGCAGKGGCCWNALIWGTWVTTHPRVQIAALALLPHGSLPALTAA